MQSRLRFLAFFATVLLAVRLHAVVVPAPLFTDNAVLQRDKPVPVWGTAEAGEKVSVAFAGQSRSTTADAAGRWRVDLAPLPANAEPAELVITGTNTLTFANILVGEVWLVSGQSNMEWTVKKTYDAALDIPASARFPLIRHIQIAKKVSTSPLATASGTWKVASASTTGDFSAAAYFFALDVHAVLNVPVGIINSSWGGTPVESWTDSAAYQTIPTEATIVQDRWSKTIAAYPAAKVKFDADLDTWKALSLIHI